MSPVTGKGLSEIWNQRHYIKREYPILLGLRLVVFSHDNWFV